MYPTCLYVDSLRSTATSSRSRTPCATLSSTASSRARVAGLGPVFTDLFEDTAYPPPPAHPGFPPAMQFHPHTNLLATPPHIPPPRLAATVVPIPALSKVGQRGFSHRFQSLESPRRLCSFLHHSHRCCPSWRLRPYKRHLRYIWCTWRRGARSTDTPYMTTTCRRTHTQVCTSAEICC